MRNRRIYNNAAFHKMRPAIFKIIQSIFVFVIEFQGHLVNIEGIVIFALLQQAITHIEHSLRLQFGIRGKLHHLLESFHGIFVILLFVQGIAQVELRFSADGLYLQRFSIIDLGFSIIAFSIKAITFTKLLLQCLGLQAKHRGQQKHQNKSLIHFTILSSQKY